MTEEKNSKAAEQEEQPKKEWKFNKEQYDRLTECSKKGPEGIKEWNKWREEHPLEKIWLQGADLSNAHLQRAYLWQANLQGAHFIGANLQGAYLFDANLQEAE